MTASPRPLRVLLNAVGSHGDVLPVVALARALQRRGHEAWVFANAVFEPVVQGAGLRFIATGDAHAYRAAQRRGHLADRRAGVALLGQRVLEGIERAYPALVDAHAPGRTLVVGTSLAWATRQLAETHSVPCAVLHLSPSWLRSTHDTPSLGASDLGRAPRWLKGGLYRVVDAALIDPHFTAPFNRLRAARGLPPVRRAFQDWIHDADLVLGLFPSWFAPPQPDWPGRVVLTDFPFDVAGRPDRLSDEVQAFLAAGEGPVVLTAGTANAGTADFFARGLAACRQVGRRALLVSPVREHLPDFLAPDALHVDQVPFERLLPRVAAIVHHGGIGTVAQALRAGVPQLVCPMGFDQFDNARRLARLGAGGQTAPDTLQGADLARILASPGETASRRRVLQESVRRGHGVDQAVERLLALASVPGTGACPLSAPATRRPSPSTPASTGTTSPSCAR